MIIKSMNLTTRRELQVSLRQKCRDASWVDRSKLLDGFVAATGYERKYAIQLLNSTMSAIWKHMNDYLTRWLRRKYKHLARHKTRARRTLGRLARSFKHAFVHWNWDVSLRLDDGSRMS